MNLESLIDPIKRKAYRAVLEQSNADEALGSKFGGTPYFEQDDEWPICEKCNIPLYFICQLDLREWDDVGLPANTFGLLSFFYCWRCYPCETGKPGWLLRNYRNPSAEKRKMIMMPPIPSPTGGWLGKLFSGDANATVTKPCRVSFSAMQSIPEFDQFEAMIPDEARQQLSKRDEIIDEYYELHEKVTETSDDYGTQVGGYASWIQGSPEQRCHHCGDQLELLLQVGSEPKADLMFGDAGAMYFSYCPSHPDVIMMESQCF